MKQDERIAYLAMLLWVLTVQFVLGSTGMPWETPMQRIADSLTGGFGAAVATVAIAFAGFRWFRGAEHGLETMISVVVGCAFIFGATRMVSAFSGGAGATPLVTPLALAGVGAAKDIAGELCGHLWALGWLYAAWKVAR